jgi:hypothetical protein
MTATTGPPSPQQRSVSAATCADWRRRRQADAAATETMARDFAESQQAGLAAVIAVATVTAPLPAIDPSPQQPALPEAPPDPAASAAPARPAPEEAHEAQLTAGPRSPESPGGPSAVTAEAKQKRSASKAGRIALLRWPVLAAILATQAVLSLRLVWSNTASMREATYLSAGHVEIAHWLHGTAVPPYATFLPGAPVIYPPVAAMTDSLRGLAAARILSLVFVLGATLLLWNTASRLFGWRAAVCAAALFAVLGPTLQLGALATPDAMALFLLAASVWCVVSSQDRDDSAPRLLAGVVFLAVASATLYSTMIFIPAVVALAGLTVAGKRGAKPAVARAGYVAAGVLGLISALMAVGGPWYLAGVLQTTVSPTSDGNAALLAVTDAWEWAGLVWVIAGAAVVLCALRRKNRVQMAILAVLATSGVLPVLIQASTRTTTSFSGYVGFGAWFAAAAAGYALARLTQIGRRKSLHLALVGLALAAVALPSALKGRAQAAEIFQGWPNSAPMVAQLRSFTQAHPGHYLAEGYSVPAYYLEGSTSWDLWSGTWYFSYRRPGVARPLTGMAAYRAAISNHYFSLIMLNFRDTLRTDFYITAALHRAGYERIGTAGRYTIWAYPPSGPPVSDRGSG